MKRNKSFNMQRIVFNMAVNNYILQTKYPPPKKNKIENEISMGNWCQEREEVL